MILSMFTVAKAILEVLTVLQELKVIRSALLLRLVGGVAQWLGCRSVAGGLSLICA